MSRTHQYRKVMKPLLERKRRARINKYLDEMKELMIDAIQPEGDAINKLEKADVLELTVKHLSQLKEQHMLRLQPMDGHAAFRDGFTACANQVSRYLSSCSGVSLHFGTSLMAHLGSSLGASSSSPDSHSPPSPPPASDGGYNSGRESTPSPQPLADVVKAEESSAVWRPF